MTKAELVEEVSRVSNLTKKHSEVIVDTVFKSIIEALHRGEKIELRGFGSFRLRKREPRKGGNQDRRQSGRAAEEGALLQAGKTKMINRGPGARKSRRAQLPGLRILTWGLVAPGRQGKSREPTGKGVLLQQSQPPNQPPSSCRGTRLLRHPQPYQYNNGT